MTKKKKIWIIAVCAAIVLVVVLWAVGGSVRLQWFPEFRELENPPARLQILEFKGDTYVYEIEDAETIAEYADQLLNHSTYRIHLPLWGGTGLSLNWICADGTVTKVPLHTFERGGFQYLYNWGKLQARAEEYVKTHEPTEII